MGANRSGRATEMPLSHHGKPSNVLLRVSQVTPTPYKVCAVVFVFTRAVLTLHATIL
jgi:hypothetical protein